MVRTVSIGVVVGLLPVALLAFLPGAESPGPLPSASNAVPRDLVPRWRADGSWAVAILSDIQAGFCYLPEVLERVQEEEPTAVLLLGDLATRPNWTHLQLPVRELRRACLEVPLFAIPGNHDVRGAENRVEFAACFGGTEFEVGLGSIRLVGLDNSGFEPVAEATLTRLERAFSRARERGQRIVLCTHRDLIDWEGKTRRGSEVEHARVLDLIAAWKVELVLCGHYHWTHDEVRGPTRFVVVPPTGDRFRGSEMAPVSFTVLEEREGKLMLRQERLFRHGTTELGGALNHFLLAHTDARAVAAAWLALVAVVGLVVRFRPGRRASGQS